MLLVPELICIQEENCIFYCTMLIIASEWSNVCVQGSTFGIPGVEQHAHFLRDVSNATHIRNHLIANWNKANLPTRTQEERSRLLQIVVVGGGPTGVEFAGELSSFISSVCHSISLSQYCTSVFLMLAFLCKFHCLSPSPARHRWLHRT